MMNYNPGKLNVFGSIGFRQDDWQRINDVSTLQYTNGLQTSQMIIYKLSHSRPISNIGSLGTDYKIHDRNKIGVSGNYNYRFQRQNEVSTYAKDSFLVRKEEYTRARYFPEFESDLELTSFFQHKFA